MNVGKQTKSMQILTSYNPKSDSQIGNLFGYKPLN